MAAPESLKHLLQRLSALLLLTLLGTACSHPQANGANGSYAKRMYIDANLSFSMALPEHWQRADPDSWPSPAVPNVTWIFPPESSAAQPEVMVRVISRTPETARGGFARMKADYLLERPRIEELSSLSRVVNRYPALQLIGQFADRKLLTVFITSSRRAFTLEFLTAGAHFDDYLPIFEDIMNSFRVL